MINGEWLMINGEWLMINGEWLMINGEWLMINGEIGRGVYKTYGIVERWVAFQWVYSGSTVGLQWVYNEQKTKEWRTENEPTMKVRQI